MPGRTRRFDPTPPRCGDSTEGAAIRLGFFHWREKARAAPDFVDRSQKRCFCRLHQRKLLTWLLLTPVSKIPVYAWAHLLLARRNHRRASR